MRNGVLHLGFTVSPGELGNSYLIGHSSNIYKNKGEFDEVFKNIKGKGEKGDIFVIYDQKGRKLSFEVFEVRLIEEDDTEKAYQVIEGQRIVTLQTSVNDPSKRWIIRGRLIY